VKNVAYQPWTQQLRDYAQYAGETNRLFYLYVRPNTTLSRPLVEAWDARQVTVLKIPF
jgi:hypothetical protein